LYPFLVSADWHGQTKELPPSEILIHCGDLYNSPGPDDEIRTRIATSMECYRYVIGVAGNHDRGSVCSPIDTMRHLNPTKFFMFSRTINSIIIDNINFVLVPWMPEIKDIEVMIEYKIKKGYSNVLITHGTPLAEARGYDRFVIPPGIEKKFDFVFAGHIHRSAVYGNVYIPGSIEKIDFGERDDTKGVFAFDGKKATFIEIESKKMYFFGNLPIDEARKVIATYPPGSLVRGNVVVEDGLPVTIDRNDIELEIGIIRPKKSRTTGTIVSDWRENLKNFTGKDELVALAEKILMEE